MDFIILLLAIIVIIVTSSMLSKQFPYIPLALFQIILGALVSWAPIDINLSSFEPEVFMICLIGPLLFVDARLTSRKELWVYKKPILLMAAGLVLITIIGIGYVIHFLIPSMPIAAAFALAAVLSPTDAVAVKSIIRGLPLPKSLMPILEGESLLNDAAGIVSFKVALAVVLTGVFSPHEAALDFLFVSIGGIFIGLLLGYFFVKLRLVLRQHGFEEINSLVAIELITPFIIFIVAEQLSVSGILAVVTAGILHGIERDRLLQTTTKIQITSATTWSVISYILNGFVFVLLGFLLPGVIVGLVSSHEISMLSVLGITLLVALGLFVIRYIWVYVFHSEFTKLESVNPYSTDDSDEVSRGRYAFLAATCGIHGTITLATALSIPYLLGNGEPFPYRNTILFIAAGVILISLIFGSITLPLMMKKQPAPAPTKAAMTVQEATVHIIQRTITLLQAEAEPEQTRAVMRVIRDLEEQRRYTEEGKAFKISNSALRQFQLIGLAAEKDELSRMIEQESISPQISALCLLLYRNQKVYTFRSYMQRLWFKMRLRKVKQRMKLISQRTGSSSMLVHTEKFTSIVNEFFQVINTLQKAAIRAIHEQMDADNRYEALLVIQQYSRRMRREEEDSEAEEQMMQQQTTVQLRSIQIKRDLVQQLEESNQITARDRFELLQLINYDEMLLLDNHLDM